MPWSEIAKKSIAFADLARLFADACTGKDYVDRFKYVNGCENQRKSKEALPNFKLQGYIRVPQTTTRFESRDALKFG